jgi:poly-D-alanine transfer protein DltD
VTSSSEERWARLHPTCSDQVSVTFMYPMGDDVFLIERGGEASLVDSANLRSLLQQLSGKDILP